MSKCPCGCGRKVPFMRGGAATAAEQLKQPIAMLRNIISSNGPETEAALRCGPVARDGESIFSVLVDHIHGTAHPSTHPNLFQLSGMQRTWLTNASSVINKYACIAKTSENIHYSAKDAIAAVLRADPVINEFDANEHEKIIAMAIDYAMEHIHSMGLADTPPQRVGTMYLEGAESTGSLVDAHMQYKYAKLNGATDDDFRLWHDQLPLQRLSIMAIHGFAIAIAFQLLSDTTGDPQQAKALLHRRFLQFGAPLPLAVADEDQPLPWELRPKVIKHWADLRNGADIPSTYISANRYIRSWLAKG